MKTLVNNGILTTPAQWFHPFSDYYLQYAEDKLTFKTCFEAIMWLAGKIKLKIRLLLQNIHRVETKITKSLVINRAQGLREGVHKVHRTPAREVWRPGRMKIGTLSFYVIKSKFDSSFRQLQRR